MLSLPPTTHTHAHTLTVLQRFNSQRTHGNSQLSVSPIPGDSTSSSGFQRHQACKQCPTIHAGKMPTHAKEKKINLKTNKNGDKIVTVSDKD